MNSCCFHFYFLSSSAISVSPYLVMKTHYFFLIFTITKLKICLSSFTPKCTFLVMLPVFVNSVALAHYLSSDLMNFAWRKEEKPRSPSSLFHIQCIISTAVHLEAHVLPCLCLPGAFLQGASVVSSGFKVKIPYPITQILYKPFCSTTRVLLPPVLSALLLLTPKPLLTHIL